LPGQCRFFRKNNSILDISRNYNSDIFIHTWKRDDDTFTAAPYNGVGPFQITARDIDEYIKLYSPKKYKVETELTVDLIKTKLKRENYERTSSVQTKYNMYRYFYSLNRCAEMIDNLDEYDFVIITRSDMVNIGIPDLNSLSRDCILVPTICDQSAARGCPHLITDAMLCVLPSHSLKIYIELINSFDSYYDKGYHFNWEEMFYAHLKETNLLDKAITGHPEFFFQIKRNEDGSILTSRS